jgi:uncharacterized membrane protein
MITIDMRHPENVRGPLKRELRARASRNLSPVERWVSIVSGTGLAIYGLTRVKSNGWIPAVVGGLLVRRGLTAHCEVYQAFGINTARSASDTRRVLGRSGGINVKESVTLNRSIEELYRFWRNLEHLPRFMHHLESVERITDTISHWRAKGPGGTVMDWNAEIINEVPNQLIGWRSLEGADVVSAGSVNFDRGDPALGTRVTVHLQYSPPGGKVGAAVAKLFRRDAATEIREDLQRFKQLVESDPVPAD